MFPHCFQRKELYGNSRANRLSPTKRHTSTLSQLCNNWSRLKVFLFDAELFKEMREKLSGVLTFGFHRLHSNQSGRSPEYATVFLGFECAGKNVQSIDWSVWIKVSENTMDKEMTIQAEILARVQEIPPLSTSASKL
jgi:hypothetical protein